MLVSIWYQRVTFKINIEFVCDEAIPRSHMDSIIYEEWLLNNQADVIKLLFVTNDAINFIALNVISLAIPEPLHRNFPLCKPMLEDLFYQLIESLRHFCFDRFPAFKSFLLQLLQWISQDGDAVLCLEHLHRQSETGWFIDLVEEYRNDSSTNHVFVPISNEQLELQCS